VKRAALATLLLGAGCAAERLPPLTADHYTKDEDETHLWRDSEELEYRMERSGALDPDPALERYLTGVARRLLSRRAQERLHVRVRVLDDPNLNAFALPNGGMYFTTGILARIENEAQLATVMGHEIIHAVNRHSIVEYRTFKNSRAVSASIPGAGMFGLGALGTKVAVTGYSRDLEREADVQGLALVAAAGYDVAQSPKVFEHFAAWLEEEKIDEPYFFGDHPRVKERMENFKALLATDYAGRRGGDVGTERYTGVVREVLLRNARLDLGAGRFSAAERGARRYLELRPKSAEAWALFGDAARQARGSGGEDRALEHYRQAIALDARCAEAQRGLGLLLMKRGEREGARTALHTYLKLRPRAEDRAWVEAELAEVEGRKP
jgi:predicted Zn-dependent protease